MFDDFNPQLFHEGLTHEHIANIFQYTYHKPTSAEFVQIYLKRNEDGSTEIDICTYGESVFLKLKSKPEDADIIKRMFGLKEIEF
jgi:hypothetical protein